MGRSQRHMIYVQNAPANGEAISEGQPAPGFILQAGEPPAARGIENIAVVEGPLGGPLQGSTIIAAVPEAGTGPDPNAPTIYSLDPTSTPVATPVQITITGTNFAEDSTVQADGNGVVSAYVSATEMTADLPSFAEPKQLAITVTTDGLVSGPAPFSIVAARSGDARILPYGPLTIVRIEDHEDGIAVQLASGDVHVGDDVLIEATGNTQVNGNYTVLAIEGSAVIIDSAYELAAPIEAKGRLTVNGEM